MGRAVAPVRCGHASTYWLVRKSHPQPACLRFVRASVAAAVLLAAFVGSRPQEPAIARELHSHPLSTVVPKSSVGAQEASSAASASSTPPGSAMAARESACASRSGTMHAGGGVGELWFSRGAGAVKLLVDERTKVLHERGGAPLSEARIHGCSFSPDERSLYFLADNYGTSAGLYEVALDTGVVLFLGAANDFLVVTTCSDPALAGTLAIYRHDYAQPLKGFAFDWWVLIRPKTGAQIGPIGPADENLDRFLAVRCGHGEAPPVPPAEPSVLALPPLAQLGKACKHDSITLEQTRLLDGTTLGVFQLKNAASAMPVLAEDFPDLVREWQCARGLRASITF